jgi:hypothetical protein
VIKLAREHHAVQQACCLGFLCLECSLLLSVNNFRLEFWTFRSQNCSFFEIVRFFRNCQLFSKLSIFFEVKIVLFSKYSIFFEVVLLRLNLPRKEKKRRENDPIDSDWRKYRIVVFLFYWREDELFQKEKKLRHFEVFFLLRSFIHWSQNSRRTP